MPVGSGAPNPSTTPLSRRAASESRRAAYSPLEIPCPERSEGSWARAGMASTRARAARENVRIETTVRRRLRIAGGSGFEDPDLSRVQRHAPNHPALGVVPPASLAIQREAGDRLKWSRQFQLDRRTTGPIPDEHQVPAIRPDEKVVVEFPRVTGGDPHRERRVQNGNRIAPEQPHQELDGLERQLLAAVPPDQAEIIVGTVADDGGARLLVPDLVDPQVLDPRRRQKGGERSGPPLSLLLLRLAGRGRESGLVDPDRLPAAEPIGLLEEVPLKTWTKVGLDGDRVRRPGFRVGMKRQDIEGALPPGAGTLQPAGIGPHHTAEQNVEARIASAGGAGAGRQNLGIVASTAVPPEWDVLFVVDLEGDDAPVASE